MKSRTMSPKQFLAVAACAIAKKETEPMNYEKLARQMDDVLRDDNQTIADAAKFIERACLESQLKMIREVHKRKNIAYCVCDTLGDAYSQSVMEIETEIEAKLKAMK